MKVIAIFIMIHLVFSSCSNNNIEKWWPQFRGPEGSGVASESARPPVKFEDKNLIWKTDLPIGFSSPVIWKDNIFLTGFIPDKKELTTICLDRNNGKILWQKSVFPDTLEKHHSISNPAQNTVVTDGERVMTYFSSCGLICYDINGREQWKYSKSCPKYSYGNATSPIISDNKLILIDDEGKDRYLLALDKTNGKTIWKTGFKLDTLSSQGGQSTPCLYNNMIIVHRIGEVAAYSAIDGTYLWGYKTLTEAAGSPIIAGDKVLVNCWYNLGDDNEKSKLPDYAGLLQKYDSDKNGKISKAELSDDLMIFQRIEIKDIERTSLSVKNAFKDIDEDGDKEIDIKEWESFLDYLKPYYKPSCLIAIKSEMRGELSDSSLAWRVTKNVSEVPSPIYYRGRVYMITDGGIITCINPESGKILYQSRIGNPGAYLASPIAANGLLYLFGYNGKLTVIKAGDELNIVTKHDFKDNIAASPAIIGRSIYIRTKAGMVAYSN